MGKQFKHQFSEPVRFVPRGTYLRGDIPKDEALKLFREEELLYSNKSTIVMEDIVEGYIRFQFTQKDLMEDGIDMSIWVSCEKLDANAQRCWVVF